MKRITLLLLLFACEISAQQVTTRSLFWFAPSVNFKLNPRWMLVGDALYRFELSDGDHFQAGLRAGVAYKTKNNFQWTAGPCYFLHYPNPNGRPPRPEWRLWQEVSRRFEFGVHHALQPRIRFEQRFIKEYSGNELAEGIPFHTWRLRLRTEYFYSFSDSSDGRWGLVAGDEFMFHRRANGFTSMDQNRAWAGVSYKLSSSMLFQLTYLHIYQQRSNSVFDQFHVIRLAVQLSFNTPRAI